MELTFEDLLGKVMLVGITYNTSTGELIERKQVWGTVAQAGEGGIRIRRENGELFSVPPNLSAISSAAPGDYTLRSTGEVVTDPNFLSAWTCTEPD